MQSGRSAQSTKNSNLLAILIFLILVIIGLAISLIVVGVNKSSETSQNNLIDTSEKMAGYNGPIDDSTKALILTETIQDKLSSDPNYNPDQAIAEYQEVFNKASGNLKLYVAIEYANYFYQTLDDFNQAIAILDSITNLVNTSNEEDYYLALFNLYNAANNTEKANEYQQILNQKAEAKATQKEPGT